VFGTRAQLELAMALFVQVVIRFHQMSSVTENIIYLLLFQWFLFKYIFHLIIIFKVLFQQFKFFLNLYFLLMACSQFFPPIQIGSPITYWGPLVF